jgi:hypothetical protein
VPSSSSIGFQTQLTRHIPFGFEAQTKKPSRWFWGPNHQTVAAGFEAQTEKPSTTDFEVKPKEIVATDFEAKPEETIPVILRPNHW